MKIAALISLIILLSMAGCSGSAGSSSGGQMSGGGGVEAVGNGGSIVVEGEEYKLADLSFKKAAGEKFLPDEAIQSRLELLRTLLSQWGALANYYVGEPSAVTRFFDSEIFSPVVSFKFVGKLPSFCRDVMEVEKGEAVQFACTEGSVTWIVPKLFKKLSFNERVASIVHERMHGWNSELSHSAIAPIIRGVVVFQRVYEEFDASHICRNLSDDELEDLNGMLYAGEKLKLLNPYDGMPILRHGGARVSLDATIDPGACLGIGTVAIGKVKVAQRVLAHRTILYDATNPYEKTGVVLASGTSVEGGWVCNSEIGEETTVKDSNIYKSKLSGKSQIEHSWVRDAIVAEGAVFKNYRILDHLPLNTYIVIGKNVRIENSTASGRYGATFGDNLVMRDSNIFTTGKLSISPELTIVGYEYEGGEDLVIDKNFP